MPHMINLPHNFKVEYDYNDNVLKYGLSNVAIDENINKHIIYIVAF